MPRTTLAELLARNRRHVESLPEHHFSAVEDSQSPAMVSVCCSDSRVSQEGMWDVDEPGWLFSVANIGNQTWDAVGNERVVNGDVLYPLRYTGTDTAAVVGHTGCGAITATLEDVHGETKGELPPGIKQRVSWLRAVIEDGLDDARVRTDRDVNLVDQLVEYNVDRQVAYLRENEEVPDGTTILGFVYDFQGVYGDVRGRSYLVNHDGETDIDRLAEAVPDGYEDHVERLLA
ncbi:carbonic anhydrase [Natronomonas amylolytica]|uniref:carbonic anhydrase n=1 Tax=Natronomonas amylolytica TaxID=3108498 RepID=UPI00300B45D9